MKSLTPVLSAYPSLWRPKQIEALGNAGGFSGAQFWRLQSSEGPLCLRRWPRENPTLEHLEFVHAVLGHVAASGFRLVPAPLETQHRVTYVRQGGYLWELTPWMPGQADFRSRLSVARLRLALEALAQFHQAAATFPWSGPRLGPSPGIRRRSDQLKRWCSGDLQRLGQSIQPGIWPGLDQRAQRICRLVPLAAPAVAGVLSRAAQANVVLQACAGDIWHDHVLFEGDQVSGLIDFGSMCIDSVAIDVARLLGSMADDDPALWRAGLESYQTVRPLSDAEQLLVEAFDRSTVLMAGLMWIEWIYEERRTFEDVQEIPLRLDGLLRRLEHLRHRVADPIWCG
jgi:homoserine kinase type II